MTLPLTQRKAKAKQDFPPPRARGKGKGKAGWEGGIPTASPAAVVARGGAKRGKVAVDEGTKAVNVLRNNLKKAAERAIGSAEAECDSIGDGNEKGLRTYGNPPFYPAIFWLSKVMFAPRTS